MKENDWGNPYDSTSGCGYENWCAVCGITFYGSKYHNTCKKCSDASLANGDRLTDAQRAAIQSILNSGPIGVDYAST